jgi:transcriptional regulator with XRE-family HTH domain
MRLMTRERKARGWSKAELSRRAGLTNSQVGAFESGRQVPYPVQLRRIAEALEYKGDLDALLEEVQDGEPL